MEKENSAFRSNNGAIPHLLFGDIPVVDLQAMIVYLEPKKATQKPIWVARYQLNLRAELISAIQSLFGSAGTAYGSTKAIRMRLTSSGYEIVQDIGVFPSADKPRFFMTLEDHQPLHFLASSIFLPRQYALSLPKRLMLWAFAAACKIPNVGKLFVKTRYLVVKRC